MLMTFGAIITTRQYVGNPIDCIHTKDVPEEVLNTYCWIHSTYTVMSAFKKEVGVEVAYPGIATSKNSKDNKVYKYYQWVCFCLLLQVSDTNFVSRDILNLTFFILGHSQSEETKKQNKQTKKNKDTATIRTDSVKDIDKLEYSVKPC